MTRFDECSQVEKIPPMKLLEENKLVGGFRLRSLLKACPERVQKTCEDVWELMTKKEIHPVVDKTFHFEQVTNMITIFLNLQKLLNHLFLQKIIVTNFPSFSTHVLIMNNVNLFFGFFH